jgi:hypothetical protein
MQGDAGFGRVRWRFIHGGKAEERKYGRETESLVGFASWTRGPKNRGRDGLCLSESD